MISEYELANIITGATRAEGGVAHKSSATILGKAVENSEDGMVRVVPEGDVFAPDGDNTIIIPTSPSVRAGDTVQIGLVGGVSKRPMVVAASGEGDRQDGAIADAAHAAQVAWNYADSAHTAASQAQTAAQQAQTDAATAKGAAEQAVEDAATAYTAAQNAQTSADNAATAAGQAQTSANAANTAAQQAQADATAANTAAQQAQADATTAKNSATQANTAANSALTQLSVIEDVAGTLDWISKHGTYALTSDTTVQDGTVYFEKVGNDYIPIAEPTGNPHTQGWYTLDVTDSQSDYIMAHLAVTSAGLWVLPSGIGSAADEQHAAGYKTLLSSTGMTIYDDTGRAVATYGEGITFDSSRELKIGNNNAYIEYYDSNGDEIADSLRISANSITLGGSDIADTYATKDEAATMGDGSGESVTVDSGSRLRSLEVEGKSVQGGTPTPSSPVPIQVVSGINLYDATAYTTDGNNVCTHTIEDSSTVTVTPTTVNTGWSHYNQYFNGILETGKTYTISCHFSGNVNNRKLGLGIRKNDNSGYLVAISTVTNESGDLSVTFTADSENFGIWWYIVYQAAPGSGTLATVTFSDIILCAGSTATPYVPYGSLGLQVSGKNRLDTPYATSLPYTHRGVTFSDNGDGGIAVSGTAAGGDSFVSLMQYNSANNDLTVGETYTLSTHSDTVKARVYSAGGGTTTDASVTYTVASESWQFLLCVQNGNTANTVVYPQIERGSTATDYTPYIDSLTEIPLQGHVLASLPDGTKDVLTVDASGHVTLTKRMERVSVNGSETWTTIKTNLYEMSLTNKTANGTTGSSSNQMCSHFRIANADGVTNPAAWVYTSGSSTKLRVGGSGLTSLGITDAASFKTWAASNPFVFYYKLATAQTVDLGYITMPELADGCTVEVLASLTPTFGASWYTENGAALVDFATKSELQVTADGITSTVEANYTSKDEFAANKSVRFKLLRDSWTESNWAGQESLGRSANWSNIHKNSAGADVQTGYDFSTLHVGDLIVAEGMATDSKAPHSILLSVETVPTTATGVANCTVVSFVTSKQLATRITQTESEIALRATTKELESATNMLYDTDVPTITKVNAPNNRYWSESGNTDITCSIVSLSDPPEPGIKYAARFVCDGSASAARTRGLAFYNANNLTDIPLVVGQKYTATWWARCTSGSCRGTILSWRYKSNNTNKNGDIFPLTAKWVKCTQLVEVQSMPTDLQRLWFQAATLASTSCTVELCGFKLVAGDSAENVSAELSVQADKIAMVVDDSTTSSSLVLTSQAMDYIGDHVTIKGTDGTSTVISGGKIQANSLTIGSMTVETQSEILNSNIEIGGRNLLLNSAVVNDLTVAPYSNSTSTVDTTSPAKIDGAQRYFMSGPKYIQVDFPTLETGSDYSFSFDINRAGASAQPVYVTIGGTTSNQGSTVVNKWVRYSLVFTASSSTTNARINVYSAASSAGSTYIGYVRCVKLEKGNKATDWSPAPEDQTAYVDSTVNAIEVGGTNLVMGTGDYNGWIFTDTAKVTKSGNILDINVSGQTANTWCRGRGWLSVPFATLKETAPTIIVSVEVFSDDWSAVTSDSAAGFASASVQLCTVMGDIGTQTAGETKRYRYMGLNQTTMWQSIPTAENNKWLKFVSFPIAVPDGFGSDVSKGDGTNVLADVMLRRNGHVKWRNLKVEAGNKATAWSPAPEDAIAYVDAIEIGGTNLITKTGENFPVSGTTSSSAYFVDFNYSNGKIGNQYNLEEGVTYTFSVDVTSSSVPFNVSVGAGTGGYLRDIKQQSFQSNGRCSITFTPTASNLSQGTVFAFRAPRQGTAGAVTYTVDKPKLEIGNKATDWSPAPEDMASAADSIEYIVGTQSAATGSWTGVTKESTLVAGKTIAYRLPYAGSGNASLNLTLAGGGTTGAKAVYSMTTRVTTQYPANSIIQMTYDGTYWRTTGWYYTDTNARYVQFYNTIVAKSAIRAASIIGGDSSGYEEATAGAVFDLSYPIMWTTAAIAAAATDYSHIYTLCYDRTLATCYSSFTGTKNKIVYLVGTASGNKFTVDSSIITSTEPTEEDGKIYIPIGRLGNDTNGKNYFNFSTSLPVTPYAYLGGSFQRVDLSTSVRVSDVEGGLQMAVSDIATVTGTANAASDGVSSLNTRVNAQEETLTQVKTTFTFSTTGLTIGKSGSAMQSTFGNTSLQFKSGNTVVLELDAEKSTAKADRFAIGKYQLKSVDNGNAIAFVYVGG